MSADARERVRDLEAFFRSSLRAAARDPAGDMLFPRSQLTTPAYEMLAGLCLEARGGFVSWTHKDGERFLHVTFSPARVAQFEDEKRLRAEKGKDFQSVLDSVCRASRETGVQDLPEWARAAHKDTGLPDPRAPYQLGWLEGWQDGASAAAADVAAAAGPSADPGLGAGAMVVWGPGPAGGAGSGAARGDAGAARKAGAGAVVRPTGLSKDKIDVFARRQRKALRAFRDCGAVAHGIGEREGEDGVKDMLYKGLTGEERGELQRLCADLELGHVTRRERRDTSAGEVVESVDLVTRHKPRIAEFREETERQKETGPLLTEAPGNRAFRMRPLEREEAMPTAPPSPGVARVEAVAEEGDQPAWPAADTYPAAGPAAAPGPKAGGIPDPRDQPLAPPQHRAPPREPASLDFWHDYKRWVHTQGDELDQFVHHVLREMLVGYAVSEDSEHSPLALMPGLLRNPEQVLEVVGRLPQRVVAADQTEMSLEPLNDSEEDKKIMDEFWDVCAQSFTAGFIRPRPT